MSVSLFRRWRSQKFSDLVGQEAVVSTLQNVLGAGDPARAYLFCGPRGTGKTSSARIFAKALNCENGPAAEPCNECSQCRSISDGSNLDVFEIDAASHTQVDKIRDFIVEKVHFTPVSARYKVYIIDEVHKLSTSSFNALLKTLEEPPPHVVFVLATTHPHEMPSTILSRCQRYDFRPLTATETEKHIRMIAGVENISLDDDAARQLARAADGSLRDALVLFEQANVFAEGEVTRDKVLDLLGGVGYEVLEEMFTDLQQGNASAALQRLDDWIVRGRDLKRLAESFQDHLRMLLLIKVKSEDQSIRHLSTEERQSLERLAQILSVGAITQWLRAVGEMLAEIRHGRRARLEWEMFLVSLAHPESQPNLAGLERRLERVEQNGGGGGSAPSAKPVMDPKVLARIDALERAKPQPVEVDTSKLEARLAELESKLKQLQEQPSSPRPMPPQEAKAPEEKAPTKAPEPPIPAKPEPSPISSGTLSRDIVDDWLELPEILVTGRVSRPEQPEEAETVEEPAVAEEQPPRRAPSREYEFEDSIPPIEDDPEPEPEPQPPIVNEEPAEELPEPPEEPALEPEIVEKTEPPQAEAPTAVNGSTSMERAETMAEPVAEPIAKEAAPPPKAASSQLDPKEFFRLLMQQVKEQDIRLHAVLADARLMALESDRFELAVPAGYQWHYNKIIEGKNLLQSVAKGLNAGAEMRMECSIGGEKVAPPKENEHEELVKRATGVFGGSSIVE